MGNLMKRIFVLFTLFHDPVTNVDLYITCKCSDGMSTLHCTAEGESLTYSWSGPGLPTAGMSGQTGPQISHENQDSVYTCNVSNPVSHSSVSFHARDCFGTRYQPHSKSIGPIVVWIVGWLATVALVVALALGVWCWFKKMKERVKGGTGIETVPSEEKLDDKRPLLQALPTEFPIPLPRAHGDVNASLVLGPSPGHENKLVNMYVTGQSEGQKIEWTSQDRGDEQHNPEESVAPQTPSENAEHSLTLQRQQHTDLIPDSPSLSVDNHGVNKSSASLEISTNGEQNDSTEIDGKMDSSSLFITHQDDQSEPEGKSGLPTAGMSGQTGPQISHENQDSVFTCNVSNPVSHGSVSFHARDCFGTRVLGLTLSPLKTAALS
ncbi:uncharacterized protein LOC134464211 [Engraulis encrasicolus]|uniref:uncharacterized protein LOC134464211 n=1 Tax=Engraulis encrasicolus TaxID=184585 RepID=UPI002FD6F47D